MKFFTGLRLSFLAMLFFAVCAFSYDYNFQNLYQDSDQFYQLAFENDVDFFQSMRTDYYPIPGEDENSWFVFDFFKRLYDQNRLSRAVVYETNKIPKVFHYIWLGGKLPEHFRLLLQTWIEMHPSWTFIFWVDNPENYDLGFLVKDAVFDSVQDLLSFPGFSGGHFVVDVDNLVFDNRMFFDATRNYGERSDILRWEIVYRFGGVYFDVDCECFKPLDMLNHIYDFYAGIQPLDTVTVQLGAALFGAVPYHPILKKCVETIAQDSYYSQIVVKTGPIHFTKSFLSAAGKPGYVDIAFPASYFYPCAYGQAGMPHCYWIQPESFAAHHWAGSWLRTEGWEQF